MSRAYSTTARAQRDARAQSWLDIASNSESSDENQPDMSTALPPSPWTPLYNIRPEAPTPESPDVDLEEEYHRHYLSPIASALSPAYSSDSNSPASPPSRVLPASLLRSVSEGIPDSRSFARPPKFTVRDPDSLPLPALSSSASTFTRSSAYTSSGSALTSSDYDHDHVHVVSQDEGNVGLGITSDDVVQLLQNGSSSSRALVDQTRWPESYSSGIRSRSSSVIHPPESPAILSYDIAWQTVDERDEDDETDDEQMHDMDRELEEEERTSAAVIAEEGRGLIVHGGGLATTQLLVGAGTTHLLVGSSDTPNSMPSFLTNTIPQISNSLLALDISANFLGALPPCLAMCNHLEELNVASNPLRVLPAFLSELISLQVLIADSTGLATLPSSLAELDKLHTLSVRRNKMYSLPSWLCLLPSLQTLCVDGNPFQGPWQALVEPLLTKIPATPVYPPSTPMFPLPSAGLETDDAGDDYSSSGYSSPEARSPMANEEEHTVTPNNAPFMRPSEPEAPETESRPLTRTRTTPSRAAYLSRSKSTAPAHPSPTIPVVNNTHDASDLRKMKSAGDLRRGLVSKSTVDPSPASPPVRPAMTQFAASSSNLLDSSPPRPPMSKRYGSLGPSSTLNNARTGESSTGSSPRPALRQPLWDNISESEDAERPTNGSPYSKQKSNVSRGKDGKEKNSRWGFLKKMSMGKMRTDSPSRSTSSQSRPIPRQNDTPQINMRFSTMGSLEDALPSNSSPSPAFVVSPSETTNGQYLTAPSLSLLSPPSSTQPRSAKRRSFLPIDGPMSISTPDASSFLPGVIASGDHEEPDDVRRVPSPEVAQIARREEERAREAYIRALRSVMAYLKDMNDLGLSQQPAPTPNPMSMYGSPEEYTIRSRRGTNAEPSRENSFASSSNSDVSGQLRSMDAMSGLRNGTASQTLSVASTGSSSDERKYKDDKRKRAMIVREIVETERTYVKQLQEIIDIYVKPAQLPANILSGVGSSKESVVPAHERRIVFSGIDALFSFHKESFLPALEVAAAPIMKSTGQQLSDIDPDGQLSSDVAKAVGNMFLKHTAFMRMYSSYVNNFDSSVQRIKHWTTERPQTGGSSPASSSTLSPSSSTSQLVGLGLSMSAISTPGMTPDPSQTATGVPNLTTSQRRKIKTYLKRCRMNPRHSQLNLECYLLLLVQRVPRYRLLLEDLVRSTPPTADYLEDPLDKAVLEISSLASNMNEGKRESESRGKLVQWQGRIRGKFPSPLVQPHRRLIMDGPLRLTRIVRKAMVSFDAINAQGDASTVQVDCLDPELTPRSLVAILCNDLLVLCKNTSEGQDNGFVDLWAVLRMQRLPQPASIVHGNALRLVDNKAILYFDAPTPSDALNWFRAINLHIPASKS